MKHLITVFVLVLSLAFAGTGWAAQGRGKGKSKKSEAPVSASEKKKPEAKPEKEKEKEKGGKPGHVPGWGKDEPDKIRVWFRTHRSGLPPGLAKREQLPPGLQKQLVRNGTLPPGLNKKLLQPLPVKLEVELPKLEPGYRRYVIGGHVILVEESTAKIVDIVRDVIQ